LFGGLRVPLVGLRLPTRNLDAEERQLVDRTITSLYDRFVEKVAAMRELPVETVREIAQGRVWSGADAVDRGLCDDFGGLADALDEVKVLSEIGPDDEYRIEEFPARRHFGLPSLGGISSIFARLTGSGLQDSALGPEDDYDIQYLRALAENPGTPQLLLPPEHIPVGWREP
jgi:protease-4